MSEIRQAKLKVSIKTFGCQMNMYDTEVAEGLLEKDGFEIVADGFGDGESEAHFMPKADVVLMNTCSVREHAEERVYGRLGMLGKAKTRNPDLIVGLMGCMVEEHREKLFKKFPQLDLMIGTRNIKDLPALVDKVKQERRQVSQIKQEGISIEYTEQIKRKGKLHAWLPIMTGCNKVCTYCIVPITRGSEVSMAARDVYREAARLVSEGVKCITLLGQNVNSYNSQGVDSGVPLSAAVLKEGKSEFPALLEMLCGIEGLERISFTTSHPHDATEELYQVIARNSKISRRFHLPLQSASDRMLKKMKRLHTFAEYKEKVSRMREVIPDVSITTDIIVGFSGEDEEDFEATANALREIRYDGAYIYKYSVRPGTPAAKLPDDIPFSIKEERNAALLKIQKEIEREINQSQIGKTVEVFVEDVNPKDASQVLGRTSAEKTVLFPSSAAVLGGIQKVKIESLVNETFFGSPVTA